MGVESARLCTCLWGNGGKSSHWPHSCFWVLAVGGKARVLAPFLYTHRHTSPPATTRTAGDWHGSVHLAQAGRVHGRGRDGTLHPGVRLHLHLHMRPRYALSSKQVRCCVVSVVGVGSPSCVLSLPRVCSFFVGVDMASPPSSCLSLRQFYVWSRLVCSPPSPPLPE